jgi:hypothetical protein
VFDRGAYRFFGEDGAARGPLDNEGIVSLQQCQLKWRVKNSLMYPQEMPFEIRRHIVVGVLKIDEGRLWSYGCTVDDPWDKTVQSSDRADTGPNRTGTKRGV